MSLIAAWDASTPNLAYHGDNKFAFTQYIGSDGTCTAQTPVPDPPTDAKCTHALADSGGKLSAYYDKSSDKVIVRAELPDSSYAGWGWGASMTNTEMIIFSADGDQSSASTYYSSGTTEP